MQKKKWMRSMLALVTAFFVTTSFGGTFARSAWAAESVNAGNDNKTVVGALVALGLLTAMSGHDNGGGASSPTYTLPASTTTTKPAEKPANQPSSGGASLSAEQQQAFNLLNADRAAHGLKPLVFNQALAKLADNYAQDMINRNFFAHNNPEGQTPFDRMKKAGITYRYAGENLAINRNVAAAETAFMNSSGHRANILNANYTQVGIGVRHNAKGSVYVVQEFIGK